LSPTQLTVMVLALLTPHWRRLREARAAHTGDTLAGVYTETDPLIDLPKLSAEETLIQMLPLKRAFWKLLIKKLQV